MLWWLSLLWLVLSPSGEGSYSRSYGRKKFEDSFVEKCSKYSFVQKYLDLQHRSEQQELNRYMLFVYSDGGKGHLGGLGDRLGGLLTAIAYSIRTSRILVIQGDRALKESFTPYHPSYLHDKDNKISRNRTWANWEEWSGWSNDYEKYNMTYLNYCVNPRPSNTICALEADFNTRVVKYKGNRAYLCRWAVNPKIKPLKLFHNLGITDVDSVDLFEVSGCLLRLALWPTAKLWSTVDELVSRSFSSLTSGTTASYRHQIGFHFRCGDASFANNNKDVVDSSCVLQQGQQWNGTHFMDDFTMESPVDHALCGKKVLESIKDGQSHVLAYVASDNKRSSAQINETLQWPHTIVPGDICHVDLSANSLCALSTFAQWLMLSLSDTIVMQALIPDATIGAYHDPMGSYKEEGPVSAFSRFAAVYSLSTQAFKYGISCKAVDTKQLSRQTQGNWICQPKIFF